MLGGITPPSDSPSESYALTELVDSSESFDFQVNKVSQISNSLIGEHLQRDSDNLGLIPPLTYGGEAMSLENCIPLDYFVALEQIGVESSGNDSLRQQTQSIFLRTNPLGMTSNQDIDLIQNEFIGRAKHNNFEDCSKDFADVGFEEEHQSELVPWEWAQNDNELSRNQTFSWNDVSAIPSFGYETSHHEDRVLETISTHASTDDSWQQDLALIQEGLIERTEHKNFEEGPKGYTDVGSEEHQSNELPYLIPLGWSQNEISWTQMFPWKDVSAVPSMQGSLVDVEFRNNKKHWTEEDKALVIQLKNEGKSWVEMESILKRSSNYISRYYNTHIKKKDLPNIELIANELKKEKNLMIEYKKQGKSYPEIARLLNRPLFTIESAFKKIKKQGGASLKWRKYKAWTKEDIDLFLKYKAEGLKNPIIADKMNRTIESINYCIKSLLRNASDQSTAVMESGQQEQEFVDWETFEAQKD